MSGGYSTELWLSRADELHAQHERQHHIWEELRWDPLLDAGNITVEVDGSSVTLGGTVPSYAERLAAEHAAKHVHGVRDVKSRLEVVLPDDRVRPDDELAEAASRALAWDVRVPDTLIEVQVASGVLTLRGTLALEAQRLAAQDAVRNLVGLRDLIDLIAIARGAAQVDLKRRIETSLRRHSELRGDRIRVEAREGNVVLRGTVRSLAEREEAEEAARTVPGVAGVDDDLEVLP
jgi:osmotically-inducible protein OsmY